MPQVPPFPLLCQHGRGPGERVNDDTDNPFVNDVLI